MTEDLWYHALKFLDKFRTDVHNNDISELYQFADKTGVLDRHRELLAQPFNENQVDMKIMYYELIKMLIDYERLNHPDSYHATKTVGKIEGYQELTNKLQRYLNQRFIVDIEGLSTKQTKITQVFGDDIQNSNFLQKIENLELNYSKIEETNKKLLEEIQALKEKNVEVTTDSKTTNYSLAALVTKSNETWLSVENTLENHKVSVEEIKTLVDMNSNKIEEHEATILEKLEDNKMKTDEEINILGNQINKISESMENAKNTTEDNKTNIKNLTAEMTKHSDMFATIDSDYDEMKDHIRKVVDNADNVKKTIQVLENQHIETVERMREVTVMTSNMESYVQTQEKKIEQEKANDFNQFNEQLKELRDAHDQFDTKIMEFDADNNTVLEKLNGLERSLDSQFQKLDSADKQLMAKIEVNSLDHESRFKQMDLENKDQLEKVRQLEDAYQIQMEKGKYIDSLESRLNQIEEYKQQSDAKVRDEVDATLKRNQTQIEIIQGEVLEKIQNIQGNVAENEKALNRFNNSLEDSIKGMTLKQQQNNDSIVKFTSESVHVKETINDLKTELNSCLDDQQQTFKSLKEKVLESLKESTETVEQAEGHVTNLRELNAKLMDQVKERLVAHEAEQEKTIENVMQNNQTYLKAFKEELEKDINLLTDKSEKGDAEYHEMKRELLAMINRITSLEQSVQKQIAEVKDKLASNENSVQDTIEKSKSESKKIELLNEVKIKIERQLEDNKKDIEETKLMMKEKEVSQRNEFEIISNQVRSINDDSNKNSVSIDGLLESVTNIESQHSETVEKINQVSVLVSEYEVKTKEIGHVFKEDQRKEMKSIENQLNTIYTEYENLEKDMIDIKKDKLSQDTTLDDFLENFNKDWEGKYGELSKQTIEQTELITKTDTKMSAIIEQANVLMVNDAKQDEAIISLNKSIQNLDLKLSNLEAADLFLQESHRLLTEKTTHLEAQSKKVEDAQSSLKRQQQEEIEENMKAKVSEILATVEEFVTEQAVMGKSLDSVENQLSHTIEKVDVLEKTTPEIKNMILEKVHSFEMATTAEISNLRLSNEKNFNSLSELQNEIKNALGSITHLERTADDRFKDVQNVENTLDTQMKTAEEDVKQVKEMLVSLQFQAEKAQYVETLASQISQMDEVRQKSEAKTKDEFEVLAKTNEEEINKLKLSFLNTLAGLQDEVTQEKLMAKSEHETISNKLKDMTEQNKTHGAKLSELEPYTQEINIKVSELENKIQEKIFSLISNSEEHRSMIEKSTSSMSIFSEKIIAYEKEQKEIKENLKKDTSEEFDSFKQEIGSKVSNLFTKADTHENNLNNIEKDILALNEQRKTATEELQEQKMCMEALKTDIDNETGLIVKRFSEQRNSIESISMSLEQQFEKIDAVQANELKCLDLVNESKIAFTELEDKVRKLEEFGAEQNSLTLAVEKTVSEKLDDVAGEVKEYDDKFKEEIKNIRKDMSNDKENLWTLVVEIYSSFRGSTLVVKSEGAVSSHHHDVLGVYRMVDSYNDRPVYKQEGGENYIYYSSASSSWLVGTVVGHQYGWLRNSSTAASSARWLPDLSSGWEYRQEDSLSSWQSDDGTLRIESLRDVEKVTELIRDIKNAEEID